MFLDFWSLKQKKMFQFFFFVYSISVLENFKSVLADQPEGKKILERSLSRKSFVSSKGRSAAIFGIQFVIISFYSLFIFIEVVHFRVHPF